MTTLSESRTRKSQEILLCEECWTFVETNSVSHVSDTMPTGIVGLTRSDLIRNSAAVLKGAHYNLVVDYDEELRCVDAKCGVCRDSIVEAHIAYKIENTSGAYNRRADQTGRLIVLSIVFVPILIALALMCFDV